MGTSDLNKSILIYFLALLVAIVLVVAHVVFGKNSIRQQNQIKREIATYQVTIDSLQKIIDEKSVVLERLQNDSLYIEEQLRVKYGMSRKGERVFQFVK